MTLSQQAPRRQIRHRRLYEVIDPLLSDGGLETTLIFHYGFSLPHFAAFMLLDDAAGRHALRRYYRTYLEIAEQLDRGFVLETPTWRASYGWGAKLGFSPDEIADVNRRAVDMMVELRDDFLGRGAIVISGNIGPAGDGYSAAERMTPEEAEAYHSHQIEVFANSEADIVSAFTLTHTGEAIGIARAARRADVPCVISFTVETDGRLPSGEILADAIAQTDLATGSSPIHYMINCAHPSHFEEVLHQGGPWVERIGGLRANASKRSHAELDEAPDLDAGDPLELAQDYARVLAMLPSIRVIGGCCGTDHRHVEAIARTRGLAAPNVRA